MKRSLLTLAVLLALPPAAASAAPFGEVAFRPVGGTAACLRATGAPGELVRSTSTGVQFLQASAGGLTPVADVAAEGSVAACPQAAARPNGARILAFAIGSEGEGDAFVRVSLREPGGGWGAHTDVVPLGDFASEHPLAADVSERGVRIQAGSGFVAPGDEFSLARAGERTLTLSSSYTLPATLRGGPVKLSLRDAAPDVPNPNVLDAVARRDRDEIAVTWRTDRDVRASALSVYGTRNRSDTLDSVGFGETRGSGRRFRARIADGAGARYVQITVRVEGTRKVGTMVVRVRG